MPDEAQTITQKASGGIRPPSLLHQDRARVAGHCRRGYDRLLLRIPLAKCPLRAIAHRQRGKPESFALNSVTMDVNSGIYLVRADEGYFALSMVCTHLGCLDRMEPGPGHHRVPLPRQ